MIDTVTLDWRFGRLELPAADHYIRQAVAVTGEYSGAEIDLYQALLRPGDVALDIGANVGIFSIAMGLAVGPTGRVLAFEPQPSIFPLLQRNLAGHGLSQAEAERAILSDAEGEGEFVDLHSPPIGRAVNYGSLSIASRTFASYGGMASTPIRTVDGLALTRCDFIKVDVEGAEGLVLRGAAGTIGRCRPILSVECDRPQLVAPAIGALTAAGYRLWRFRGANMRTPNPKGAPIDDYGRISTLMLLSVPEHRLQTLDRANLASLQPVENRADFERLSAGIVKDRPDRPV
ncbi:methyltransferase FkbM [Thalassobaculum fulvum]|uniref:Methyltransferase FkbM n=1 Tax=Thalassobaculum fulvum TaxID=1633335 RepID=A0A918XQV5_9PROT|nr:FkbM family methyltransferase [Thalassobaculum fulvum]GHD48200.1 methyltransferase FkbM [Thalassobaculum fulvum]